MVMIMDILVVYQRYYPEPFRITDICEELVRMGHKVTVLTGLPNYPGGKLYDGYKRRKNRITYVNGVKIVRCSEISKGNGNNLRLFINYLSFMLSSSFKALFFNEDFDVILANQTSPVSMVIPGIILKKRKKKQMLLYCMDIWPACLAAGGIKEGSPLYKFFLKFSRWIYKSADKLYVTSENFKNYFKEVLDIDHAKYLPQYAEDVFKSVSKYSQDDKYKKHIDLVFAGSIGRMQSVDTIILAAEKIRDKVPVKIHIVGDGTELEACKSLVDRLELNHIVKFYGRRPIDEMPEFYKLADAMLVTLKRDEFVSYTLPGKVQSYMASGKAVIGAIDGAAYSVIKEAECGLCCEAENSDALADIIIDFYNSPQKRKYEENSFGYYKKHFSKEHFMDVLEENLISLAKEGTKVTKELIQQKAMQK